MNKDKPPGTSGDESVSIAPGNVDAVFDGHAEHAPDEASDHEIAGSAPGDSVISPVANRRLGPARGFLLAVVAGLVIWVVVLGVLAKLV